MRIKQLKCLMDRPDKDSVAFPLLTQAEIDQLAKYGERFTFQDGDALWEAGESDYCFYVILSGAASIRDSKDSVNEVARHEPGHFSGDVDLMTSRPAPVGGYAVGPTEALRLSAESVREVVRVEQELGGKLLLAFIRRRDILMGLPNHGILVIGSNLDPATLSIRQFLGRNRVVHQWKKPEDEETQEILKAFGLAASDMPIVFVQGHRLIQPTIETLAEVVGVRRTAQRRTYDLVIIGAGPAGLAAAVYGSSEGLQTLLLDKSAPGGQASWSSGIENYMGFPEGLTGSDLASRGLVQAQKFGTEISIPEEAVSIECGENGHLVKLADGEQISTRAVILATGASYQKLDIPGFSEFESKGVYYAATRLEAGFCKDEEVAVIGAGNSAGQAAVYLSQHCKKVSLIVRGNQLNAAMSDYLTYRVEQIPNIEVLMETQVSFVEGDTIIERIGVKGKTNATLPCAGLFVFIGASPNTGFLKGVVELDKNGFVITGDAMRAFWNENRLPYYLETSCPGIFAAGDCRVASVKRVASSVGEGSMAVTFVHRYLAL